MRELRLSELSILLHHPTVKPAWAPHMPNADVIWPSSVADTVHAYGDAQGAVLLIRVPNTDTWSWHWLMTHEKRGAEALQLAKQVLVEVFTSLGGAAICGAIPCGNRAARVMTRAIGATPTGRSVDRYGRRCINYQLERERWTQIILGQP